MREFHRHKRQPQSEHETIAWSTVYDNLAQIQRAHDYHLQQVRSMTSTVATMLSHMLRDQASSPYHPMETLKKELGKGAFMICDNEHSDRGD